MKLKHFYVSVCMVLVSILSINAQTSVTLTQAGTLSSKLPASEADRAKINELIINGPLNGYTNNTRTGRYTENTEPEGG